MDQRILVVEDNQPNRELLCDWLEVEGFEVSSAEDLAGAMASIRDKPPHAILLDVQLGSEDGLFLASWIRQDPEFRSIPVIAVTAHAMVTDQERVLRAGCNTCVSKPIDFKALDRQIRWWLAQDLSFADAPSVPNSRVP
jgi:two-component system, cell cycle response regulator DivK